jgi:SAM-dependent methyltransferase
MKKKRVLNVGGNNKTIPIPDHYKGWDHVLLDIDPTRGPDVVCDAREMTKLPKATYDAVYCSHNLEHYWRHDLPRVLKGFAHVLRPDGFVEAIVPDMKAVFAAMLERNLDVNDVLYNTVAGFPITVNDVIYGWGREIEESGEDFFAHKNGFTDRSLTLALRAYGFEHVFISYGSLQVSALGFLREPTEEQRKLLLA